MAREHALTATAAGELKRQVFISHTGQDEHAKSFAASILKPELERAGMLVFIDCRDLMPGDPWPKELASAAANSAVMVAVLSKTYPKRFWCMLELDLARHARRLAGVDRLPLVIPVFYDPPNDVLQLHAILEHWKSQAALQASAQFLIDPGAWVANIEAMKDEMQNLRRRTMQPDKDEERQLAQKVRLHMGPTLPLAPVLSSHLRDC